MILNVDKIKALNANKNFCLLNNKQPKMDDRKEKHNKKN